MKLQVIEPSVIRLTSDETRALMKIALAPQLVTVNHGGAGIIDLGLVRKVKPTLTDRKKTERKIAAAGKQSDVYALTPAGVSLVKSVTIRRK